MFLFACELYTFLFTLTIGSISANLLLTLDNPVLENELEMRYDDIGMIDRRITRLINAGLAKETDDQIIATNKGRYLIKTLGFLKRLFMHP